VIAVVDGEEVTMAELQFEARLRNLPAGSDTATRMALLQELIDRKLLAREARRLNLDGTPEHLLSMRRLTEITLAQAVLDSSKAKDRGTADAQAQQLLEQDPQRFAARQIFQVETITLGAAPNAQLREKLIRAKDLNEADRLLSAARLSGSRGRDNWDNLTLPPLVAKALAGARPGQMFVVPNGSGAVVVQVTGTSTQPIAPEQRLALARASIEQQGSQAAMQQLLAGLRGKAEITYQRGYGAQQQPR
jgi:EpsD family peptidyl-prolyl cis-trans isomerase